jgi:hypothetical protein
MITHPTLAHHAGDVLNCLQGAATRANQQTEFGAVQLDFDVVALNIDYGFACCADRRSKSN